MCYAMLLVAQEQEWVFRISTVSSTPTDHRSKLNYSVGLYKEEVTVHPLGGANMSRDRTGGEGVTDHLGQVFTGRGSEIHKGLVCCDASIIPTALGGWTQDSSAKAACADLPGVNPLATISALAERSVDLIAGDYQYPIDFSSSNGTLDSTSKPGISNHRQHSLQDKDMHRSLLSIGWQFTEALEGHISTQSNTVDFSVSEVLGKGSSSVIRMLLTIEICRNKG
jgi:hypothetical protein